MLLLFREGCDEKQRLANHADRREFSSISLALCDLPSA